MALKVLHLEATSLLRVSRLDPSSRLVLVAVHQALSLNMVPVVHLQRVPSSAQEVHQVKVRPRLALVVHHKAFPWLTYKMILAFLVVPKVFHTSLQVDHKYLVLLQTQEAPQLQDQASYLLHRQFPVHLDMDQAFLRVISSQVSQ